MTLTRRLSNPASGAAHHTAACSITERGNGTLRCSDFEVVQLQLTSRSAMLSLPRCCDFFHPQ